MSRTWQPCNSSARPNRAPGGPECSGWRRGRPFRGRRERDTARFCRPGGRPGRLPESPRPSVSSLLTSARSRAYFCFLGEDLFQFLGHGRNGLLAKRHGPTLRGDDVVLLTPGGGVQRGEIDAAVGPAAFATG